MAIMNRRNAALGWAIWSAAKWVAKQRASTAVPGRGDHAGLNKGAIVSIVAVLGGTVWLWHKMSDQDPLTE